MNAANANLDVEAANDIWTPPDSLDMKWVPEAAADPPMICCPV